MTEVSIFTYGNYRDFLQKAFQTRKASRSSYTLGKFSIELGFNTSNYAGLVIDGKRNLTVENIHRVIQALQLTNDEADFFEALVLLDQVETSGAKNHYRNRLTKIKKLNPKSSARLPLKKMLTDIHFPAVILLLEGARPEEAVAKIICELPVLKEKAEAILKAVLEQGLLVLNKGVYQLNHSHQIFHDVRSRSLQHKSYLKNQLALSDKMLDRCYEKGAKFYAHTFTIPKGQILECENRLRELMADLTLLSEEDFGCQNVMQLNMQFFALGKDFYQNR